MRFKSTDILSLFFLFFAGLMPNESLAQDNRQIRAYDFKDTVNISVHPMRDYYSFDQKAIVINRRSQELAATFDDPSRVMYRQAGISLDNDQNNSIVYRGLPSEYVRWSVDGAEIVNPNHLSNAGRLSDQSSPAAGGVLAIPFDVIKSFSFYGSPYGNSQVNAMSANSDFDFDADGSNFVKLGLLGMEAAIQTEGKINTKAHARYSTVGLLADMGVDFDGEQIRFYDLFTRTELGDHLALTISLGRSTNNKMAVQDSLEVQNFEDAQQIDFESQFIITGLTYKKANSEQALFFSHSSNERISSIFYNFDNLSSLPQSTFFRRDESLLSYTNRHRWTLRDAVISLDSRFNYLNNEMERSDLFMSGEETSLRLSPSMDYMTGLGQADLQLSPQLGLHYILSGNADFRWEPSFSAKLSLDKHSLEYSFSVKHRRDRITQIQDFEIDRLNRNISNMLAYKLQLDEAGLIFLTRIFDMDIELPTLGVRELIWGVQDIDYNDVSDELNMSDRISSRGVEFIADKQWSRQWYTHFNISFIDVQNQDLNLPGRHDFGHIINLSVSKEWELRHQRQFIVNIAWHNRGGTNEYFYQTNSDSFTSSQLENFSRIDMRLQWGNNKSLWVLDIQNMTGRINDAFNFYDPLLDEYVSENQLGLIPILSYKRYL